MNKINCKLCTETIRKEIIKEYNNKVIDDEISEIKNLYLNITYKDSSKEYYINGKNILFNYTDLEPSKIQKTLMVEDKKIFLFTNQKSELLITDDIKKGILKFASKGLHVSFNKEKVIIYLIGYLKTKIENLNDYNIEYNFSIGNHIIKQIDNINIFPEKISKIEKLFYKNNIHKLEFNINDLVDNEEDIFVNNSVTFNVIIDGYEIKYPIKMKKRVKKEKYNYLPFLTKKVGNYYIMARKSAKQNLMIIKREIEDIEKTRSFNLYESTIFTLFFKVLGAIYKIFPTKKINLYFEKFASKAEEGTFELFEMARNSKKTRNYYIITKSKENQQFFKHKNVIAKHSFLYYILLFASSRIISTEAPTHLNLLRTKNKHIKKSIYDKKFVFLQHGITYLKCQGRNSSFTKGKEAYPNLIVVSSKKEAIVVNQALKVSINNILITGMTIFDKIEYNHINKNSKDKIIIMLTWKPYEEQLTDFSKSTYYKNTLNIFNILSKLINKEDIIIIPHPKVKEKMLSTPFGKSVYSGMISDILTEGKLVITDYSSICYNSFYQGAGIIFYQPDLELYELDNGKLIPKDEEYIGYRCFNDNELKNILVKGIQNKKINLDFYRTEKFISNYSSINEYHDGCNTKRIYEELKERNII